MHAATKQRQQHGPWGWTELRCRRKRRGPTPRMPAAGRKGMDGRSQGRAALAWRVGRAWVPSLRSPQATPMPAAGRKGARLAAAGGPRHAGAACKTRARLPPKAAESAVGCLLEHPRGGRTRDSWPACGRGMGLARSLRRASTVCVCISARMPAQLLHATLGHSCVERGPGRLGRVVMGLSLRGALACERACVAYSHVGRVPTPPTCLPPTATP